MSDAGILHGRFDDLEQDEPFAGVRRRRFDSDKATVTRYDFDPNATFPIHRHPEEQITVVVRGELTFSAGAERIECSAGDWSVVGADVEHGITAGPDGAGILVTLVPRREGRDAYTVVT